MNNEIQRVKVVVFPDGRLDSDNAAQFLGYSPKTNDAVGRDRAEVCQARQDFLLFGRSSEVDG
jgi:hypothetical protein